MTDFAVLVGKVLEQRKRTAEVIDTYFSELESLVDDISSCSSSEVLWSYRDRLEDIRASVYKLIKSTSRNIGESREAYKEGMRYSMTKTKNTGGLHFSEREAGYEVKNIDSYKVLTNLERSLTDITNFSKYLDARLQWVKERQRWLQEKEKGF